MNRFLIPFGLFIVVVGFLAVGLTLNPRELPSPLVGKTAPEFSLPQLHDPGKVISSNDLKGQVWLTQFLGFVVWGLQGRASGTRPPGAVRRSSHLWYGL